MNPEYVNLLISEEKEYSDKLAYKYRYPDNITHLLYLIIPAFIIKYGPHHKETIEKVFMDVPIRIDDKQDKMYQAYYFSYPESINAKIITKKGIVLSNYKNITLMQLLDNLVHEYNHAINSINNEVIIDKEIKIRTGISFNLFNKHDLSFIKKTPEIVLEEVINTKQTEKAIDIINEFSTLKINDTEVSNTLYSIEHSISSTYKSNSYLLESIVCKKLMENKTFISTLEKLRFDGEVSDIYFWFDNITGDKNSFSKLLSLLSQILDLGTKLATSFFKKTKINKIRSLTKEALEIVEKFNNNTIFK